MILNLFLDILASPLVWFIIAFIVLYFAGGILQQFVEKVISLFTAIPSGFTGKILPAFVRVIYLNWYTYLSFLLLWLLLFLTQVGTDMTSSYLTSLEKGYWFRFSAYGVLFILTLMMSLATWLLPFYMYSEKRQKEIRSNYIGFYLGTKMLALVAMIPFLVITNRFVFYPDSAEKTFKSIFLDNAVAVLVFLATVRIIKYIGERPVIKQTIQATGKGISSLFIRREINPYLNILLKIFFRVALLNAALSFIWVPNLHNIPAIFILLSSAIVFGLLFYTDESSSTKELQKIKGKSPDENIKLQVESMIGEANRGFSKLPNQLLFLGLILLIVYFYAIPSLEGTSALYILLIVFSFFIVYFDYWRNKYQNSTGKKRIIPFLATVIVLIAPFLSARNQFIIPLTDIPPTFLERPSLEDAIKNRVAAIDATYPGKNVFIICAMGGGSRAGYITAAVLDKLDSLDPTIRARTICYSTVSGGSVGTYTYFKGSERHKLDTTFLRNAYQRNYNSSGVFGLLVGDALGRVVGLTGWRDRNYRIRKEYDYSLEEALSDHPTYNYFRDTFYPCLADSASENDLFKSWFYSHGTAFPIHLINSLEINNGKRAVITPFTPSAADFFPNAVLPLQDTNNDPAIKNKDIYYRSAVNLSELFPFVSAAASVGKGSDQFVDGGYYENYGLTTAMDVYNFLLADSLVKNPSRIKVILIKNSKQVPTKSGHQLQLLAPAVGALNSPFTGHANHLSMEALRILTSARYYVIEFPADEAKVPLTRTLTKAHIDSMQHFIRDIEVHYPDLRNFLRE